MDKKKTAPKPKEKPKNIEKDAEYQRRMDSQAKYNANEYDSIVRNKMKRKKPYKVKEQK